MAYYEVEFSYSDEQLFRSGATMTPEEASLLKNLLLRYEAAGYLSDPSVQTSKAIRQTLSSIVDEIHDAVGDGYSLESGASKCQNCGRRWDNNMLTPLTEVKDLLERVLPGEPMPSGECPICKALCQPIQEHGC